MKRREFMKIAGLSLASFAALKTFSWNAQAADPLVKEGEGMAKNLGYCANGDKPSKACPERKAKDKAKQYCRNCQLYTKTSGDGKDEIGKCMLFPKNTVPAAAWCKSWVQKPGTTL